MQSLREIREMLSEGGISPRKRFAQHFLIDKNLMGKLIELSEPLGARTVLEVGSGTGSLTEELLDRAGRVVAVEIDRGLCELVQRYLGQRENLTLIRGDVLRGKHRINPDVLEALGDRAVMVGNLPYSIATPLIAESLITSHHAATGDASGCLFERLTFTVQREVGERFTAGPGQSPYGSISVLVSLLGQVERGPVVPESAFWPIPKVSSRMLRIDFAESAASELKSSDVLTLLLRLSFTHRRKKMSTIARSRNSGFSREALLDAMSDARVDTSLRPERVAPEQYLRMANILTEGG